MSDSDKCPRCGGFLRWVNLPKATYIGDAKTGQDTIAYTTVQICTKCGAIKWSKDRAEKKE